MRKIRKLNVKDQPHIEKQFQPCLVDNFEPIFFTILQHFSLILFSSSRQAEFLYSCLFNIVYLFRLTEAKKKQNESMWACRNAKTFNRQIR